MARTSQRGRVRAALLAALTTFALVGTACSTPTPPASSPSSTPSVTEATTREVDTDLGKVTVPGEATRVVAGDYFVGFTLMDLGVPLVGVSGSDYSDQGETYSEGAKDAEMVGTWTDVDYEAILAAKPDLIVRGIDTDEDTYKRLSDIAPTVVISFQGLSLNEVTQRVGDVVGRSDKATELIEELETRTTKIKTEHADALADNTFDLVTPTGDGQWWLYGPAWTDLTVLTQAGAQLGVTAAGQTEQVVPYAYEQLDILEEADVILTDAYTDYAEFEASGL
ncbi:ABC transporter substrate-binding protein [Tessaracoccus caeni]|uniref:ABC transporter substrate-binding protein n=1 Tax=Tessaracoccus caeni TaxID=3031239 RepID=UPI0023DB27E3|nr:ABC transporter substrate-binding protein [Tessaracoccus caeni]MDF1488720.1 ABC transporter substrate-binding protein [Tessaracoccus caeni]